MCELRQHQKTLFKQSFGVCYLFSFRFQITDVLLCQNTKPITFQYANSGQEKLSYMHIYKIGGFFLVEGSQANFLFIISPLKKSTEKNTQVHF